MEGTEHRRDGAVEQICLSLKIGSKVLDVTKLLLIEQAEKICFVNGAYCDFGMKLNDGDEVEIFPLIDGG